MRTEAGTPGGARSWLACATGCQAPTPLVLMPMPCPPCFLLPLVPLSSNHTAGLIQGRKRGKKVCPVTQPWSSPVGGEEGMASPDLALWGLGIWEG